MSKIHPSQNCYGGQVKSKIGVGIGSGGEGGEDAETGRRGDTESLSTGASCGAQGVAEDRSQMSEGRDQMVEDGSGGAPVDGLCWKLRLNMKEIFCLDGGARV